MVVLFFFFNLEQGTPEGPEGVGQGVEKSESSRWMVDGAAQNSPGCSAWVDPVCGKVPAMAFNC